MSDISLKKPEAQAPEGSGAALTSPRDSRRWRTDLSGYGFMLPFLIVYVLFLLWPVLLMLRMSFFNWSLDGHGTTDFLRLPNSVAVFSDSNFWQALWNTLVFTVIST